MHLHDPAYVDPPEVQRRYAAEDKILDNHLLYELIEDIIRWGKYMDPEEFTELVRAGMGEYDRRPTPHPIVKAMLAKMDEEDKRNAE